ncbi:hypothetical protein L6164_030771 [Bauhinia variegata]|uniref:Uncharacterized protein n=1 Tax=Bauhinia variegata TaxID=167791 RepID=A0ACB9LDR4_BAUVA|nr:hypothetical protein L6164_030771 [Bauhinia variegata]
MRAHRRIENSLYLIGSITILTVRLLWPGLGLLGFDQQWVAVVGVETISRALRGGFLRVEHKKVKRRKVVVWVWGNVLVENTSLSPGPDKVSNANVWNVITAKRKEKPQILFLRVRERGSFFSRQLAGVVASSSILLAITLISRAFFSFFFPIMISLGISNVQRSW